MSKIIFQGRLSEVNRQKVVDRAIQSLHSEEGIDARRYLVKERGISREVVHRFNVGYCPMRVQNFLSGRIITPIYDVYGDLVAISTRHLNVNHSNRFWHESFEKGFYLYGMHTAKPQIVKYKKAIIVEGEFDVLSLHSYGIDIVVGVCGSSLSLFQTSLLSRYCSDIYLVFDGDKSGRAAIRRAMEMHSRFKLGDMGIKFFPTYLPDEKDPDDFVKEYGKKQFIDLLKQRKEKGFT